MKHKILFSLLIHEEPDVVLETILNILKYNPGSGIVLHINPHFSQGRSSLTLEDLLGLLPSIDAGIYVNPQRLEVGFANLIQAHDSNCSFAHSIDYDYFCFVSSNEMFLRAGLSEEIGEHSFGCQYLNPKKWHYLDNAEKDPALTAIRQRLGGAELVYSQVEGSFYRKEIIEKLFEEIDKDFDWHHDVDLYPREEIYFSTVAKALYPNADRYDGCSCKIRWQGKILFVPIRTADAVKAGKVAGAYSVKRVDRRLDDYLRCYIRHYLLQDDQDLQAFLKKPLPVVPMRAIKKADRKYRFIYFWRDKIAKTYRFVLRKR